jgi:hypothetical protein
MRRFSILARSLYSLHHTSNIHCVRQWKIYSDFMTICKCSDTKAIQEFHDTYIRDYEAMLRSESPDLSFLDPTDERVVVEPDIYPRIMATAAYDLGTDENVSPAVLYWFSKVAVENRQLK